MQFRLARAFGAGEEKNSSKILSGAVKIGGLNGYYPNIK